MQQALRQVWLAAVASWHLAVLAEQQQQQQQVHALVSGGDEPQTPLMKPLEAFAAATSGAVERLRHTLTDASSTLESKWTALEATVGGSMSSLFMATSKSAEALNSLGPEGADGSVSRQWHQQATEIVVQHEEALYQQVFVQVCVALSRYCAKFGANYAGKLCAVTSLTVFCPHSEKSS